MRFRRVAVWLAVAMLLAGCDAASPTPTASTPAAVIPSAAEVAADLEAVVKTSPGDLEPRRLATGVLPPANRWYAALALGEQPQPVFPLPLSFALSDSGFEVGLPQLTISTDTILGPHLAALSLDIGADQQVVVSDDPSVVVLEASAGGEVLGRTTLAQGWPFVAFSAAKDVSVQLSPSPRVVAEGLLSWQVGDTDYAARIEGGNLEGDRLQLARGGSVVVWAVPTGQQSEALAEAAAGIPTASTLNYVVGQDEVTTTLSYQASAPTVLARLPHQAGEQVCDLGDYASVLGVLSLCGEAELSWTVPRVEALGALDLSALSDAEHKELAEVLDDDMAGLGSFADDSYFGGKSLQRAAMLLMVADELGLADQADRVQSLLEEQLDEWFELEGCGQRRVRCFVHDPVGGGMVGMAPSFGSEVFNDHHFHYGHFFTAAAVVAARDPSVVDRYRPMLTLLAASIAGQGNPAFSDHRVFDAYAGHSWASGTAPFADGNNQESISEAVNAWAGLELWAEAAGDTALAERAAWLLAQEAAAGQEYWTGVDPEDFPGYGHQLVSLVWGGKRDYATWFSPAPAAKLAIAVLPMTPTSSYLAGDPERIRAQVAEATAGEFRQTYGDYLLMYSALAGQQDRQAALDQAREFPADLIDNGLSRTYLLAWLLGLPR